MNTKIRLLQLQLVSGFYLLLYNIKLKLKTIRERNLKMLTYKTILSKLETNIGIIKKYGVKRIGLFGSYIREEQRPTSDVDILVEFEKGKTTFDNYMDLKFFLEDLFKCKVDLVMKDAIKPDLKPYILGSVKYAACV